MYSTATGMNSDLSLLVAHTIKKSFSIAVLYIYKI